MLQSTELLPERKYQIKIDPRMDRKPQTKQKLLSKRSVDLFMVVYWFIGLLVYWFIGLLVYWFMVGESTTGGEVGDGSTGGSRGGGGVVGLEEGSFGEASVGVRIRNPL